VIGTVFEKLVVHEAVTVAVFEKVVFQKPVMVTAFRFNVSPKSVTVGSFDRLDLLRIGVGHRFS